jgi:hypothetical protein
MLLATGWRIGWARRPSAAPGERPKERGDALAATCRRPAAVVGASEQRRRGEQAEAGQDHSYVRPGAASAGAAGSPRRRSTYGAGRAGWRDGRPRGLPRCAARHRLPPRFTRPLRNRIGNANRIAVRCPVGTAVREGQGPERR